MRDSSTALERAVSFTPDETIAIVRDVIVALIRREDVALSSHQLGVYLTCYLLKGDHTVRGLAAHLDVSKSVVTRALDKLGELDLARRREDPRDGRSVLVEQTQAGWELLKELREVAASTFRQRRESGIENCSGANLRE